ncbi:saccharopine dehydrogenase NADP-binding domain-containing protein [Candidatus Villigracilis affinis]|uniref:saccharopine dehydrogenase family protein n=1 Tax=Candidatus Villigracilis affinis TaxID=3140682 RepID=UPI001D5ECE70|nr:saccharopine dehydrogenase NADP-binding domain-containing protein [Anaerolineales bacterium]
MKKFLIYGSYGYTGSLIVEQAVKEGMRPLLAGRDERLLQAQAEKFGLEYRAFSIDDTAALDSALREVDAVLHCAGPFVLTYRQMAEACIRTKRHYVDISGEIEGFEALAAMDEEAKRAGIMLLPGGGFDVVPSDCLIAHVAKKLESATHLEIYIKSIGSGVSRGTARSGIENMQRQGRIRRDGKIVSVPNVWGSKQVDFGRGPSRVVSVGWGDVSTAYHSTGIPNVTAYMGFPAAMVNGMRLTRYFGFLLYNRTAKDFIKWLIGIFLKTGPSRNQNENGFSLMIAEATDGKQTVRAKLRTPEAYHLTALTAVEIMKRITSEDYKIGFQTPSKAYGADFILQFAGVMREDL